jgi:hypothetical protein
MTIILEQIVIGRLKKKAATEVEGKYPLDHAFLGSLTKRVGGGSGLT